MFKKKPTLLIVDDEKDICDFERSFFQRRNFKTYTAQTAAKAITLAKKFQPDIAAIDIHMGKENGQEVLKRLLRVSPRSKCLMITWDKEKALEAKIIGAVDFLIKPVDLKELERSINRIMKK